MSIQNSSWAGVQGSLARVGELEYKVYLHNSGEYMSLFINEKLNFKTDNETAHRSLSNEEINQKYVTGEFRIAAEQTRYQLPSIVEMVESGHYELNSEIQKRHRWYEDKKSQLIESFIMNVPIPPIFLFEDRYSHYEVMDGLQRLTAIYEFYTNRLVLTGLGRWSELNGRKYFELPEQIKYGIDRQYLLSLILLHETAIKSEEEAKQLKQLVLERINAGGITPQESRSAIYNGPLNQLCRQLSRNKYLCRTWGVPEPTTDETKEVPKKLLENETYQKMEDVELVLRFFAYRQRLNYHWTSSKKYLDSFLNYGNRLPAKVLGHLEQLFNQTIELVYDTFGEQAFCPKNNGQWNWQSPSKTVYEPLMYVFSQHLTEAELIRQHRPTFQKRLAVLYEENQENFWKKTLLQSDMIEMNTLFENFVINIIGSSKT